MRSEVNALHKLGGGVAGCVARVCCNLAQELEVGGHALELQDECMRVGCPKRNQQIAVTMQPAGT